MVKKMIASYKTNAW